MVRVLYVSHVDQEITVFLFGTITLFILFLNNTHILSKYFGKIGGGGIHCPKNNMKLRIKAESVTAGADATIYVWFLFTWLRNQIYMYHCIFSNRAASWVSMQRFRLFVGTVWGTRTLDCQQQPPERSSHWPQESSRDFPNIYILYNWVFSGAHKAVLGSLKS